MLQRATSSGVGPIVCYTTDDTKLEQLVRCAKENAGTVYCLVGIHSDNIKRANDRCMLRSHRGPVIFYGRNGLSVRTADVHCAPARAVPARQSVFGKGPHQHVLPVSRSWLPQQGQQRQQNTVLL